MGTSPLLWFRAVAVCKSKGEWRALKVGISHLWQGEMGSGKSYEMTVFSYRQPPLAGKVPQRGGAVAVCKSKGKGVLSELAFPAAWYDEKRGCRKAAFKSLVTPDP